MAWHKLLVLILYQLECGPMPNVMAALPNIGGRGALCSTVNTAKFGWCPLLKCRAVTLPQIPLKFAGVPQTPEPISATSGPKFAILWGHVEEVLLLNKFFFRLSIHALVVKIQPVKVVRWSADGNFCVLYFQRAMCSTFQTCILNSH